MNYKALALGAAVGFVFALVPSCGAAPCDETSCPSGCCSSDGQCVTAGSASACGTGGQACAACGTNEVCTAGQCLPPGVSPDGGMTKTDGGMTTNDGGMTTNDGGMTTNDGGMTTNDGGTSQCPGLTTGCCSSSGIQLTGKTNANCGSNGDPCMACMTANMFSCQDLGGIGGACVSSAVDGGMDGGAGDGGMAKTIGSPCTTNLECPSAAPVTIQGVAFNAPGVCRTTSTFGNFQFTNGYCTRPCFPAINGAPNAETDFCGTNGTCVYTLGQFGEAMNLCMRKCTSGAQCEEGYACVGLPSPLTGGACFPVQGGLPANDGGLDYVQQVVDAGPSFAPGVLGGACTMATECPGSDYAACVPEVFNGQQTGNPGGACTAECVYGDICGDEGLCLPSLFVGTGTTPLIAYQCKRACDISRTTDCRPEYACNSLGIAQAPDAGTCIGRCDNAAGTMCTAPQTCNNTTGLCQAP